MDTSQPQSHEDWLVNRARGYLKSDLPTAKAWLITAKTLFPNNFAIQYESYCIEKANRNTSQAANLLDEMLSKFSHEKQLWDEVQSLTESLQTEVHSEKNKFNKELFQSLPSKLQCHILLNIVDKTKDVLSQCRLTLLLLRQYPERIPEQGIKLMDNLITAENQAHPPSPVNQYRKYMVCDVLPLVLSSSINDLPQKNVSRWLLKTVEFYVGLITKSPAQSPSTPQSTDMLSPTGLRSIPTFSVSSLNADQPWQKLVQLLTLMGPRLGWNMDLLAPSMSLEKQWPKMQSLYRNLNHEPETDLSVSHRQLLHCTLPVFFDSLHQYVKHVDPDAYSGVSSSVNNKPLVMVEGFRRDNQHTAEHRSKKHKAESSTPQIKASKQILNINDITHSFHNALQCWDMIQSSNVLDKEFNRLLNQWKADSWLWLKHFQIDVKIYQGQHSDAIKLLTTLLDSAPNQTVQMHLKIQLASCYQSIGKLQKACEMVQSLVLSLSQMPTTQSSFHTQSSNRHLLFLRGSEAEILLYAIQLLINCFKDRAFQVLRPNDLALGHMMVLLQYDWPRYEQLFMEVVDRIRITGSFTYNSFFNYIINIDILEEFAFLKSSNGGKINLDILPVSTKAISQQRTVTRGVHKNVKEDFKAAMDKQISRANENIDEVIKTFLTVEIQLLQQALE